MSLMDKIKKNSTIKEAQILSRSKFFNEKDMLPTEIPMINVALSGKLDGGLVPGHTMLAGPSKHFKTNFALLLARTFSNAYPDGVIIFYDTEFGTPKSYIDKFGIDTNRILHCPLTDAEQLKHDLVTQLQGIEYGEKVFILIDSIGNLASKKELDDALEGKNVADMTRAKAIKSLFRMVTSHLTIKNLFMVSVNHTYKTMEMFSKDVVGGGTGAVYSADNIWILGRQQNKDGTDLTGYNFVINIDKSRYVREKSKIIISVTFDGGIEKYSGLLEVALEGGFVVKPKNGWYAKVNMETGEVGTSVREKDTETKEFWADILANEKFAEYVKKTFEVSNGQIIQED